MELDREAFVDQIRNVRMDFFEERRGSLRALPYVLFQRGNQNAVLQIESNILNPRAIQTLSGIELSESLEYLHVDGTGLVSVPDLSQLVWLDRVNLDRNRISDLTGLEGATFTRLDLDHNRIRDITAIGTMTQLVSLDVADNLIEDLSPLGNLTKLELLDADENFISDVSSLISNRNLQELDLRGNQLRDYHFVEQYDQLKEANLTGNDISVNFDSSVQLWLEQRSSRLTEVHLFPQRTGGIPLALEGDRMVVPPLKNPWSYHVQETSDFDSWKPSEDFYLENRGLSRFRLSLRAGRQFFYRVVRD